MTLGGGGAEADARASRREAPRLTALAQGVWATGGEGARPPPQNFF